MQMTSKMDLAGVESSTSVVCERRVAIPQRMSTRTPSFLSVSSAAYPMCRSGKSPVDVYNATGSIFMSVA